MTRIHTMQTAALRALRLGVLAALMLLGAAPAHAILTIEITQGTDAGFPIAVVPFGWSAPGKPPEAIADIIASDLVRSGRFVSLAREKFVSLPARKQDVVFKEWRVIEAEALVIGSIAPAGGGRYRVEFRLFDVFTQAQLAGLQYTVDRTLLRTVAHQIADVVYERLTGEPGVFNTRIAYITREEAGAGLSGAAGVFTGAAAAERVVTVVNTGS